MVSGTKVEGHARSKWVGEKGKKGADLLLNTRVSCQKRRNHCKMGKKSKTS